MKPKQMQAGQPRLHAPAFRAAADPGLMFVCGGELPRDAQMLQYQHHVQYELSWGLAISHALGVLLSVINPAWHKECFAHIIPVAAVHVGRCGRGLSAVCSLAYPLPAAAEREGYFKSPGVLREGLR